MSLAVTVPDTLEMLLGEKLDLTVDMANVMAAGDSLSLPAVTMTNTTSNETVASSFSAPVVVGASTIALTVDASKLRPKTSYDLQFNCTASGGGTTKTPSAILTIIVVQ